MYLQTISKPNITVNIVTFKRDYFLLSRSIW